MLANEEDLRVHVEMIKAAERDGRVNQAYYLRMQTLWYLYNGWIVHRYYKDPLIRIFSGLGSPAVTKKEDELTVEEVTRRVAEIRELASNAEDLSKADNARDLLFWNFTKHYVATHDDEFAAQLSLIL